MAFLLAIFKSDEDGMQGIGVAIKAGASWYYVPYEISESVDAATWITDNAAQIESDAPVIGAIIDPAVVAAYLDNNEQSGGVIADDVIDISDLFPNPAQRKVLKAIILLFLDQFNVLRNQHGLAAITPDQVRQAIIDKYKTL